jgi:hypothetical protein
VNAKVLLDDLRSRGVSIETDGEHLLINAPFGVITEELKATLSEHKARVIGIRKAGRRPTLRCQAEPVPWLHLPLRPRIRRVARFPNPGLLPVHRRESQGAAQARRHSMRRERRQPTRREWAAITPSRPAAIAGREVWCDP